MITKPQIISATSFGKQAYVTSLTPQDLSTTYVFTLDRECDTILAVSYTTNGRKEEKIEGIKTKVQYIKGVYQYLKTKGY